MLSNSKKFRDLPGIFKKVRKAVDMLSGKRQDIIELIRYMTSGDWQKDYEADERGELRGDIPKAVLSQDGLYNTLEDLDQIRHVFSDLVQISRIPRPIIIN